MKNKQRYLEPIFAQWLDISTSDNATRACLEGGVWADKTNYSCPRLSAAPAPSLEEDGDLDMSIYVYTVGRMGSLWVWSQLVSVYSMQKWKDTTKWIGNKSADNAAGCLSARQR